MCTIAAPLGGAYYLRGHCTKADDLVLLAVTNAGAGSSTMVAASYSPLLYIANASVLIAHQIDAAFWREWEMLGIPGGNPVNLFLNLPILAAVLYAHREATLETSCAHLAHRFLASLGYITVAVHSYFYFGRGATQFVEPVSIGLIVATAVLSTLQFAASRASDRSKGSAAS